MNNNFTVFVNAEPAAANVIELNQSFIMVLVMTIGLALRFSLSLEFCIGLLRAYNKSAQLL
jgi:hypothetical protein